MSISKQTNTHASLLSSREKQKSTHASEMATIREKDNISTYGIPVDDDEFRNTLSLHLSSYTQDYTVESPIYYFTEEEENDDLNKKTSSNFDQDVLDLYHKKRSLCSNTTTTTTTLTNTKFTEIKPIYKERLNELYFNIKNNQYLALLLKDILNLEDETTNTLYSLIGIPKMASKNATNLINKYITVNDTSTSFTANLDEFITTNRNKIIDRITDQIFEQFYTN